MNWRVRFRERSTASASCGVRQGDEPTSETGELAALIAVVAWLGWWALFLVGVIAPWMSAGMFQTINQYVEHMGLMGVGVMASSRSVVPRSQWGEALSEGWQNYAHHRTHHQCASIPRYNLPAVSQHVVLEQPPEFAIFPTYTAATIAMLKTLPNPRIGPQWNHVASRKLR